MKPSFYLFFLFLFILVASCQVDDHNYTMNTREISGKWKLKEIISTSMIAGQENKPFQPPYEEFYEFYSDNTFKRSRSNGYKATGTYSFKKYSEDEFGILADFDSKELCFHEVYNIKMSHPQQVFFRQIESTLLIESYMASDGQSFHYQKEELSN